MAFPFHAPLEDHLARLRRSVQALVEGSAPSWPYLHDALLSLVAIEGIGAREPAAAERIAQLRTEWTEASAPMADLLRNYVEVVADEAEEAEDAGDLGENDDWYELCEKRSAVEILVTRFAGTRAVAAIDRSDVDRFDAALRRLRQKLPRRERAPVGLPASHWWW